jgi:hypothetical protein
MGTTHEAATNDTRTGRQLNRRVLVNQGMAEDADEPTDTSSVNNPNQ